MYNIHNIVYLIFNIIYYLLLKSNTYLFNSIKQYNFSLYQNITLLIFFEGLETNLSIVHGMCYVKNGL